MTTPQKTPRTDACPHCGAKKWHETEKKVMLFTCGSAQKQSELCLEREKSQKLEDEVERLRANLHRAVEIAEILSPSCCDEEHCMDRCEVCTPLRTELEQLKATINHDKK